MKIKIFDGYEKRRRRWRTVTVLLTLITLGLCLTALMLGNTVYPLETIIRAISGEQIKGATFSVVTLRLPRMLAGLLVGLAFGIAGSTFQTMLRNPLASPDIIGITSGASVAAVFCILVLRMSGPTVSIISVITGLFVALIIFILSKGGHFYGGKLILIGIGIQAMLTSAISFLMLRASQYDIPGALRWLSGSLNGIRLSEIPLLLSIVLILGTLVLLFGRHLTILELGEHTALTLGVNTNTVRLLLILGAVILIAFATAVSGPIAFVSFLSGPIATGFVGRGTSNQLPAGLIGAILVLASDLVGQFALSVTYPVGIITGMIGAPYLITLLIKMNRSGGSA